MLFKWAESIVNKKGRKLIRESIKRITTGHTFKKRVLK